MNEVVTFIVLYVFYTLIGLFTYLAINKWVVEYEYKKFTILPVIPMYNSLNNDFRFSKLSTWLTVILYSILYLPMTVLWVPIWLLWKWCSLLVKCYVDNMEVKPIQKVAMEEEPFVSREDVQGKETKEVEDKQLWEEVPEDIQSVQG